MGTYMGNSEVAKAKAPIPTDEAKESKNEFAQLKKQFGWKDDEQYILMNRQIMYTGTRDEIIANYDNFIQRHILGGQNANISIPLGIYNHYSDYFNHTILESFNQLNHTNPYNDDFPLQKKCQDGINEWLLVAYMNCRSCKDYNSYAVRFMFQVAVYTRIDKKAQQRLDKIATEQRIQDQQQIAVANNDDNKAQEKQEQAYKIAIPLALSGEELAQFQHKFTSTITDYGWSKEEIFILMERQVLHTGMHDDIVPKYVDFFEKVVFGDKNSDHSMPTGVYDHYLTALTNTIENSLSQVADEDINEYKDTFKLQQKVDDGEREWLLIALLSCKIATKPNKSKFYVRYAVQVAVYSRIDIRMRQLQKDDKIKEAQAQILNQVQQVQNAQNDAQEGGSVDVTKQYIDVVDCGAMGLKQDNKAKQNEPEPQPPPNQQYNHPPLQAPPQPPPQPPPPSTRACFYCKQIFQASEFHSHLKQCIVRNEEVPVKKHSNYKVGNEGKGLTDEKDNESASESTGVVGLCDDVWPMDEDYTAWSCKDLADWIGILDEEFAERYVDMFVNKLLDGSNFKEFGSAHYLISKLGMKKEDAAQFADVVKKRSEARSKIFAANEAQRTSWECASCSFVNDPKFKTCKKCNKTEKNC